MKLPSPSPLNMNWLRTPNEQTYCPLKRMGGGGEFVNKINWVREGQKGTEGKGGGWGKGVSSGGARIIKKKKKKYT